MKSPFSSFPLAFFRRYLQQLIGICLLFGTTSLAPGSYLTEVTVIQTPILESHFSRPIKEPVYVVYKLYKGGGNCGRANLSFVNDFPTVRTATSKDYSHSGYDKGHLANAEDFAASCAKEKLTFVFYNALPQTPNLNRGIWKSLETKIRGWSQKGRLTVICGGYGFQKRGSLYVPKFCFKVVQNEATAEIRFCGTFTNTASAKEKDISEPQLQKILGYQLPIHRAVSRPAGR